MSPSTRKEEAMKNKSAGGLALEAAIVMVPVLLLMASLISAILTIQNGLLLRHATDLTCREITVILPLAEALSKGEKIGEANQAKFQAITGSSGQALIQAGEGLLVSEAINHFANQRIDYWLQRNLGTFKAKMEDHTRKILVQANPSGSSAYLYLTYDAWTLWGKVKRSFYANIPVWNRSLSTGPGGEYEDEGEEKEEKKDSIWEEHNFVRGKYFREKYGGNLPDTAPIASLSAGLATAIRSMDLTAPTYASSDAVSQEILLDLEKLSAYQGGKIQGIHDVITILPEDIRAKKLLLIIPENRPSAYDPHGPLMSRLKAHAHAKGILLEIVEEEASTKYKEDQPSP